LHKVALNIDGAITSAIACAKIDELLLMIIDATLSNPASSSLSATDVAAWIGAITGVGLFLWGIYTWWHSGPRLRVEALPNLFPGDLPVAPIPENRSFLQIKVYNHGDRETP
jgi:hypothetical protein